MRNLILLFVTILFAATATSAQKFISYNYIGSKTKTELNTQFGLPIFQFDVQYYKITYTSKDAAGALDTLSGLVVLPTDLEKVYPLLVYQHGTSDCKTCVPSRFGTPGGGEGDIGLVFAGMGYIALLPDYVGMGDGRGFHPYVHAATEASAAIDMVRSIPDFFGAEADKVPYSNDQLFLTGYSQGGHAAMALHREIETNLASTFTVTAAAHLSGPYSVSGVMRNLILSNDAYYYPAYIPNTALSYQTIYGNLYNTLTDVFKPAYASLIQQFYNGTITLGTLNEGLIQTLTTQTGASVARRMLQDSIVEAVENNPQHPINLALKDNDVYDWSPVAPTRIFYCMGDDQVPFMNSIVARDTMTANGATDLVALDVKPTADHGGCVVPALIQTLSFFGGKQEIGDVVSSTAPPSAAAVTISPNPVNHLLSVKNLSQGCSISLFNGLGQEVWSGKNMDAHKLNIETSHFPAGIYTIQIVAADGKKKAMSIIIQH
jgi:Secretion system C-terminal sorting domain